MMFMIVDIVPEEIIAEEMPPLPPTPLTSDTDLDYQFGSSEPALPAPHEFHGLLRAAARALLPLIIT